MLQTNDRRIGKFLSEYVNCPFYIAKIYLQTQKQVGRSPFCPFVHPLTEFMCLEAGYTNTILAQCQQSNATANNLFYDILIQVT